MHHYSAKQIKDMTETELQNRLAEVRGELRHMRFLIRQGEWREMHKMNEAKKTIARMQTELAVKLKTLTNSPKQG